MRHISTKILIFLLFVIAVLSGYNYFKRPFLSRFAQFEQQLQTAVAPAEQDPVQLVLEDLTPRERILQMISFPALLENDEASVSAELSWIATHRPGFVTLFGSGLTAEEVTAFVTAARPESGLTPLIAVDHEGGIVQRLSGQGFTRLQSWRQNCLLPSAERTPLFQQSAAELSQAGVQIVFAPDIDVAQAGSFLGSRACSDEAQIIGTASDYITSFAQHGILPVIKHFPGIGSLTTDPHFELDTVELGSQDVRVFDQLLRAFPNIGVMSTHVAVAGRTNGIPCSLSNVCLEQFSEYFPAVLLFTDALEMQSAALEEGLTDPKTLQTVSLQAVLAGNDVLVFGEEVSAAEIDAVVTELEEKYETNESFRSSVDQSVRKIIQIKLPATAEES